MIKKYAFDEAKLYHIFKRLKLYDLYEYQLYETVSSDRVLPIDSDVPFNKKKKIRFITIYFLALLFDKHWKANQWTNWLQMTHRITYTSIMTIVCDTV